MINKKFIQQLKKDHKQHAVEQQQIVNLSSTVLHDSKRVIFSLHRNNIDRAKNSLLAIEKILIDLEKKFNNNRLIEEGVYRACLEEYVEAKMFYLISTGQTIDKIKKIKLNINSYIGGICDLTGELVRVGINKASIGQYNEIVKIKEIINSIMSELIEFDLTSYLRTKYDQAKINSKKIEQINYEINLRK
ncbi:MAG: hypothetical protein ABH818_01610 [Patescibacteria group bacterium]|nr:hypothetical protein [Patescibacteria group bacterium]MBU1870534.1 hypothetical protein [Patescibacteria group bacterium]